MLFRFKDPSLYQLVSLDEEKVNLFWEGPLTLPLYTKMFIGGKG